MTAGESHEKVNNDPWLPLDKQRDGTSDLVTDFLAAPPSNPLYDMMDSDCYIERLGEY